LREGQHAKDYLRENRI